MSYNTDIQNNNADLRTILAKVNALPEAGSGEVVEPVLQEKTVTENGEVTPDDSYDGLSKVTVNVPETVPVIQPVEITANGTYTAPIGVNGYSPVTVDVPVPDGYIKPSGTKNITANGTYDVSNYASAQVDVPSSGGGAAETCTVTNLISDKFARGVAYVAADGTLVLGATIPANGQITVSKNSMVYIMAFESEGLGFSASIKLTGGTVVTGCNYTETISVFFATSDCAFEYAQ